MVGYIYKVSSTSSDEIWLWTSAHSDLWPHEAWSPWSLTAGRTGFGFSILITEQTSKQIYWQTLTASQEFEWQTALSWWRTTLPIMHWAEKTLLLWKQGLSLPDLLDISKLTWVNCIVLVMVLSYHQRKHLKKTDSVTEVHGISSSFRSTCTLMDCKYVLSSVFTQSSLLLYGMLYLCNIKECSVNMQILWDTCMYLA